MKRAPLFVGLIALSILLSACSETPRPPDVLDWERLPELPLATAGAFAGATNGALVAAGGAHFPGIPSYEGGTKVWEDTVFVLEPGATAWQAVEGLGEPRAYGASVTTEEGVVFIGGGDAERFTDEVVLVRWTGERLERTPLPPLPAPAGMMSAAILGRTIYVAGGQAAPDATEALHAFRALDLDDPEAGWQVLEPWPGPARMLPAVATVDGAVYVLSGAELIESGSGGATRRFLSDAYRYRPGAGWERLPDLPRPAVAAAAASIGASHVAVFGGDTGEHFFRQQELRDRHPGFSREVLAYHTITDTWAVLDTLPEGLVTTNVVPYQGGLVITGGEDRPGHRSPSVMAARPAPSQAQLGLPDFAVLAVYLGSLVVIGLYLAGKKKTTDDFFLAGRRIPWWAAGLSIFGTQLSAITFMAIPAKAYATDWVFLLVNMTIVFIAPVVVYFYLPFFRRLQITTAYEYLEKRFNLSVRWFGSLAFILFQLGRMGIVVALPSIALATVTGLSVYTCILIMGVLTTFYSALGGIEAVIWTDVLQVFVLLGGALLSLVLIVTRLDGGVAELIAVGSEAGKFHMFNWTWDYTMTAVWVVVVGNLFANLVPYTTDQSVIQRYLTTPDEKQAARAIWTNAFLTIPASLIFFAVGTALFAFYSTQPQSLNPNLATDAIFPWFISRQLPVGVAGIVIAGLFAAAMSSLDSSMNSIATSVVTDFYKRLRPEAPDRSRLRWARWLTLILGVTGTGMAMLIATFEVGSLWDLFLQILGLFGGSVAGVFALGIFTTRAHGTGTLIGAVSSAVILYFVQHQTDVHFFLYAAIGIVSCMTIGWLASVVIPSPGKDIHGLTVYTMGARAKRREASRPTRELLVAEQ